MSPQPPDTCTVQGLFTGRVRPRWPDRPASAIHKTAVAAPQTLTPTGFQADQQADLAVHGGADKAVHHYAADHYADWQSEGLIAPGTTPAAFGENISTLGLVETNVCIGDIFRLGTALVQISQGRQPCWKLNAHTGQDRMAYLFQKTRRTGWYYRVLETGQVAPGDSIALQERPNPHWSVAEVTHARLTHRIAPDRALALSRVAELAQGWSAAFARMATGDGAEDTGPRLTPPKS
ncbi:MOSC domain-containing protein [Sedimentitalea nanhaiensis]|uniref:MOSC domain-containing protein YiiM n=1 Tax=Sedimentitalea nanhaiensis TaxID=999627 RepID=A0A1I6ZJ38_9RHOB|nr:MOSC domain-containing protein [Sedimentitalea nanhaiensis]SFT62667.1 MOSC domain-containing protein YiiM [Sedimentitalea nanhaiensis]